MPRSRLSIVMAITTSVGMSGCAAPIKYFMERDREELASSIGDSAKKSPINASDVAASRVGNKRSPADDIVLLREALAQRSHPKPATNSRTPSAPLLQSATETSPKQPAPRQATRPEQNARADDGFAGAGSAPRPNAQEIFKLALAKRAVLPLPVRTNSLVVPSTASSKTVSPAVIVAQAVVTERLGNKGNGSSVPDRVPSVASPPAPPPIVRNEVVTGEFIAFPDNAVRLDAAGNTVLADFLRRTSPGINHSIVIVGGLAGAGEPFTRMQLASKRVDVVADHVPPPVVVEKRFDTALGAGIVRLQIEPAKP